MMSPVFTVILQVLENSAKYRKTFTNSAKWYTILSNTNLSTGTIMDDNFNINPQQWYSPNEIVDQGLLFGKSKRYVFDLIKDQKIKATNTSDTAKPQWKILGQDLINFIREMSNANSNITN